jgi:hypothetical protein
VAVAQFALVASEACFVAIAELVDVRLEISDHGDTSGVVSAFCVRHRPDADPIFISLEPGNPMLKHLVLTMMVGMTLPCLADDAGWRPLFDGQSFHGWGQRNGYALYRVEEGTVVGRTAPGSPNSFLCTLEEFADFELEFEVWVDDDLNSGVQIRSQSKDGPLGRVNGPQVEIETGNAEAGYVYGEATGRGWLTPESRLKPHTHLKSGEWNKFRVLAQGPRIQTWINGTPIEDLTDEEIYKTHPKGFIALQVHGIGKKTETYEVRWRNIRIRELK